MAFDYVGAIEAGYSPEEIARYLSEQRGFDLDGALKEGYTPQEVIKFLEAPKTGGFGESAKGAFKSQIGSTLTGIESLLGGTPEDVQKRLETKAQMQELPATSWDEVQRKYEHHGLWEAAKEAASQIPGGIGQGLGSVAQTYGAPVIGGAIGATAGSVIPGVGTALGGAAGTALGNAISFLPYYGGNVERQQQEHPGEINKLEAFGAAIPQFLIDKVTGVGGAVRNTLSRKAAGEGLEALRAASKAARGQSLAGQAARGIGRTGIEEGFGEVTQQGLERAQAGLPLTGDEAMREYKEAGFGALLASPIGAPGRIVEGGRAQSDYLRALQEQRDLRREQPDYEQKAATAAANWDIYNAQAAGPGGSTEFLPEDYYAPHNVRQEAADYLASTFGGESNTWEGTEAHKAQVYSSLTGMYADLRDAYQKAKSESDKDTMGMLAPSIARVKQHLEGMGEQGKEIVSRIDKLKSSESILKFRDSFINTTNEGLFKRYGQEGTAQAEPALQEEAPSVQDIINQSTGVSKEAAPTTAKSKAFRDFLNEPSGIMARDPETQVERELTNWEAVQQRQVEPAILMREAAARRELSDISDIEIQHALDQQTQMQIPGLEAGLYSTIPTSEEPTVAGKSAKEAPSTQQELFTKEGELNKTIVEAADLQAARQSPIVSKELLKDIGIKPHPGPKATYNVILNKDASDPTQRGEVIDALSKYLNRVKNPKVEAYLTALEAQHGVETKQTEPAAPTAPAVKQQPTVQETQATPVPINLTQSILDSLEPIEARKTTYGVNTRELQADNELHNINRLLEDAMHERDTFSQFTPSKERDNSLRELETEIASLTNKKNAYEAAKEELKRRDQEDARKADAKAYMQSVRNDLDEDVSTGRLSKEEADNIVKNAVASSSDAFTAAGKIDDAISQNETVPSPVRITNKQAKATASAIKDYYKSVDAKEPKQQLVDKRSALMSLPGITPQTLEHYDSFKTPKARNDAINAWAEEPNLFYKGAAQGRPLDSKAMQHAAKGDLNGLIRHLANTHENKDVRRVLNKVQGLGLKSSLVLGGNTAGSYDAATNTVSLHPEHGVNDHTAVHEIIHAAISHVLANPHHPLTKEFQTYFDQIQNQLGDVYGATSLQEFAAELVGNPEFQVKLKNIQSPSGQSMFRRIAQAIAEFFGFKKGQSAYEKGIDMVERAIDVSQNTPSNFADTLYMGMGKPVKEVFEAMKHVDKEAINAKEAMLDAFSNIKDSTKYKLFIDSLGLDNIADLLSSRPQASTDVKNMSVTMSNLVHNLSKTIDLRSGEMAKRIHDTSNKFITMQKAYSRHTKVFKDMSKLAIEARLESVDPLKGTDYQPNKDNPVAYNRILHQYSKLHADVKAAYATMRGDFEKARQDYLDIMFNSIDGLYKDNPSVAAALKKKYETDPKVIAYVPFSRHGDFVLEFDVNGERNVLQFESSRQRQAYVAKHLKGAPYKLYERLQDVTYDASSVGRQSLIGQVMNELQKTGATQDQLNSIYQIHLSMFPAESISKHFMKSDDVKGMSEDLLRNYTDVMLRWDRKLVSTKYMGRINADIQAAKDLADKVQDPLLHSTAQSLLDRRGFINNPTHSSWSNKATAFSYYQFIAGNISSAFVNLAVIPTVVIPKLAAMHSGSKALNAMDLAMRTGLKDWSKIPKYRKLYEEMMDRNQLTHTLDKEALEGRAMSSEGYTGLTAKAATLLSIPFAASEKYNRAVTAIAAYDLYLSKHPGKVDDAIEHAVRLVKNVHTSGMAASGSKLFHSNIGRVFFTFKSFAWNSAYNIARTAYLAWKGEDKATIKMARRQLGLTVGAAGAFSGVAGLPFYGLPSAIFAMMSAMFGDDDEPTTLEEELKAAIGETGTHGLLGALLNLNVGQRTSLANDLLLRDNPRMIEQHGHVLTYMAAMFGPAGTYALGAGDSLGLIQNGHVERGLEGLIPSFARNALKGARYMAEGAQTIKGDYVKEDVSTYNSLMQIIGFAPADLSEIQGISAARKRLETAIFNEKKRLLDEYDMGYRAGDSEYMKEVQEKITAFNQRHPYKGVMITPDTIARSRRTRLANEKFMLHGIRFNKHLIQELQSKYPEPDESEDSEI